MYMSTPAMTGINNESNKTNGCYAYDVLGSTGQQEFIHPFKGKNSINVQYDSDSQNILLGRQNENT